MIARATVLTLAMAEAGPDQLPGPAWVYLLVTPSLVLSMLVLPPRLLRVGFLVDKELARLEAELERTRKVAEAREARLVEANERKDDQLSAATKTLVDDTVPALVRVAITMENVQAELRARR